MTVPARIYSIPVNINTYETFYNWFTHERNELFELLKLDYNYFFKYTNIDRTMMTKQLINLNKHKLLSTGLISPPSLLLSVSDSRSK